MATITAASLAAAKAGGTKMGEVALTFRVERRLSMPEVTALLNELARTPHASAVIDLQDMVYADFSALAMLATVVDAETRRGREVDVHLPSASSFHPLGADVATSEAARDATTTERVSIARFLRNSGSLDAIATTGATMHGLEGLLQQYAVQQSPSSDRIVPRLMRMRWIAANILEQPSEWLPDMERVLSQGGQYLPSTIVEPLTQFVLPELVTNVNRHAGTGERPGLPDPRALVGAMVYSRGVQPSDMRNAWPNKALQAYLEALAVTALPVLKIVVSDAGAGIPATLAERYREVSMQTSLRKGSTNEEANIIRYALTPLGGRIKERGWVRALPQIVRYLRDIDGAIAIRTARTLYGRCYRDREQTEILKTALSRFAGTSIELWLPATSREGIRPATRQAWLRRTAVSPEMHMVNVSVSDYPANDETLSRFQPSAQKAILVCIPRDWDTAPAEAKAAFIRNLMKVASQEERTRLYCLWVPFDASASFAYTFQTVDDARETSSEDRLVDANLDDNRAVLLVIGADRRYRFHGGNEAMRGLLYRMVENRGVPSMRDQKVARASLRGREHGWNWFAASDDETISLAVDPFALIEQVEASSRLAVRAIVTGDKRL